MWNPIREWVALSSVHKHVTVDAADGPGNTLRIRDHQCGNTTNPDGDGRVKDPEMVDPSKIQGDYARDRERRIVENNKIRRQHIKDSEVHSGDIGDFFNWMDPRNIPAEILFLNALFITCLEIWKLATFYELLKCTSKEKYQNKKKHLKRDVHLPKKRRWATALKVALPILF